MIRINFFQMAFNYDQSFVGKFNINNLGFKQNALGILYSIDRLPEILNLPIANVKIKFPFNMKTDDTS